MNKLLEKLKAKVPGFKYLLISMAICTAIWGFILVKTYIEVGKMRERAIEEMQQARLNEEESLKAERLAAADGEKFDLKTHEMMAMYFLDKKQYGKAIPHFKRFLHIEDQLSVVDNPSTFLLFADAYIKSRRPKEALSLIEEIKKVIGSEPMLLLKEGEAYVLLGEHEKAVEVIKESLEKDSTNSAAFSQLAHAIMYVEPLSPEIEKYFNRAIELEPENVEGRYQFGVYLEKNSRYEDAIKEFKKILENEPFNTLALGRLGILYFYTGNKEQSKKMYELAVSINSTDYNTMYNLGELYLTSFSDPENGYKWFLKAVSIKPDHTAALKKLGIIAMNNRNYKEAILYLEKAEKSLEKSASVHEVDEEEVVKMHILQATAYESIGRKDAAREYFEKALSKDPVNRIARHKLALLD